MNAAADIIGIQIHARILYFGSCKPLNGRIPGAVAAVEKAAKELGLRLPDRSWVPRRYTMMGLCKTFAAACCAE